MNNSYYKRLLRFFIINLIGMQAFFGCTVCYQYFSNIKKIDSDIINGKEYYYAKNGEELFRYLDKCVNVFLEDRYVPVKSMPMEEQLGAFIEKQQAVMKKELDHNVYLSSVAIFNTSNYSCNSTYNLEAARNISYYLIERSNILKYINTHFEEMFKFDKSKLTVNSKGIAEPEYEVCNAFADYLDQKYVYFRYTGESFVVFVINDNYLNTMFSSNDATGIMPIITTGNGDFVFGKNNIDSNSEIVATHKLSFTNNCLTVVKSMSGNRLKNARDFFVLYFFILVITISVSIFIATMYSKRIVTTYRTLNNIFSMTKNDKNLSHIDIAYSKQVKKKTITHNIIVAIVLSTIVPSILSVTIYSYILDKECVEYESVGYVFYEDQLKNRVNLTINNLKNRLDSFTIDDFRNIVKNKTTRQTGEEYFLNDFLNYMVLDKEGKAIYCSKIFGNTKYSDINKYISEFVKSENGDYFICSTGLHEILDDIIVGKRIQDESGEFVGYFAYFEDTQIFNNDRINNISNFILLDKNNKPMGLKNYNISFDDEKTFLSKYSSEYLINKTSLPEYELSLYTMRTTDFQSFEIFKINMICSLLVIILSILIEWIGSTILIYAIYETVEDMNKSRTGIMVKLKNHYNEVGDIIAAYNGMIDYVNNLIEEQTELKSKQTELMYLKNRAELSALQHQINPHFLYNTLEMFNSKLLENGEKELSELIIALTKLFRYSVGSGSNNLVPLRSEIENVHNYSMIQEHRFNGKFRTEFAIEDDTLDEMVPKLTLQPIVENAYLHGFKNLLNEATVTVSSRYVEDYFELEISDNGQGIRKDELEIIKKEIFAEHDDEYAEETKFIALKNVYKRLYLYYGDKCKFEIYSEFMKETKIRILIKRQNF